MGLGGGCGLTNTSQLTHRHQIGNTILRRGVGSYFLVSRIKDIWEVSPRTGNELFFVFFCCEASNLVDLFSDFLLLGVHVNKYHCAVLRL